MNELQSKLKRDETFLRYRAILRTVREGLDLEKTTKEAMYLHKSRKSRRLYELRVSPLKLQDAILNDISNRSRLVEIKSLLLNQQELLTSAISLGKKHVRATYADLLSTYGTTKESQMLVVEKVFSGGMSTLSEIDATVDIIDAFIKDIDQAGFGLRNVVETLKMALGGTRESSV